MKLLEIFKRNPWHDAMGRFCAAEDATMMSITAGVSKELANMRAAHLTAMREREKATTERTYRDISDELRRGAVKVDEVVGDLSKETSGEYAKLSQKEKAALHDYTGFLYGRINRYLGQSKPVDAVMEESVKNISGAITKMTLPQDLILHRASMASRYGINLTGDPDSDTKTLQGSVGKTIHEKAFASTTIKDTVTDHFVNSHTNEGTPLLLEIKAPKGANGAWVGGPSDSVRSEFPQEYEVLLNKGTKYQVTGYHTKSYGQESVHVLEVTLMN